METRESEENYDLPPIASLKGRVDSAEWKLRVDLAAVYRLIALQGWDDMVFTHVSVRVPGPEPAFLINPYGLLFEEITASSLVKVDMNGRKLVASPFSINPAGFTIHSAIHMGRSDAHCIVHLHTIDGVAVSSQENGLLPLDQHAMLIADQVAYHDYEGVALDHDERQRLIADIGQKNVLILRNHGTLAVGNNCADAYMRMYYLERACTIQTRTLAGGAKPNWPNQGVPEKTARLGDERFNGLYRELAWPALRRKLDRVDPSYKN